MNIEIEDYIFGEKFETELNSIKNIYYCKIDFVWEFLKKSVTIKDEFVLITHNGDAPVTERMAQHLSNLPNLKHWFGQNIECVHDKISSIPIGLANTKNFPQYSKDLLYSVSKIDSKPEKLVYANFSFYTNPQERLDCYENIKKLKSITDRCNNLVASQDYQIWLNDIINHKYVACPRGNGIDTHRIWETLYLGRIPIVKRCLNTSFYEDLPILFIDDWSDITEALLLSNFERLSQSENFNIEKLKMSFWKNKIINFIND